MRIRPGRTACCARPRFWRCRRLHRSSAFSGRHSHLAARGDLAGWLDGPLALDVERAVRLRAAGYRIFAQAIPAEITPKNRLLLGIAGEMDPAGVA